MTTALPRWHWLILAGILAAGGALRFTAIGQGIPFALGIDEPEIMERSVRMMKTGDLHPRFFDYPGLYIYLQFIVATVRFIVGGIQGLWAHLDQAPVAEFYLWGRVVTASLGTATIALVYLAGRRISPLTGLLAAALFASQSLHIRESHFVLTDVPMTFFITLTWVLMLRAFTRTDLHAWIWAGLAAGAAAATKYNGGVAILLPAIGVLLHAAGLGWRLRAMVATGLAALGMFVVCAPYTVIALPEFLNAFAYLSHMYAEGPLRPEPAWLTYLKHLRLNFSLPGLAAAALGLGLAARAAWRADRSPATLTWVLSATFAMVYFWMISGQRLVWGRYLLPLLPFLSVLAGGGLAWAVSALAGRFRHRAVAPAAALAMTALVVALPLTNALDWLNTARKVSTQEQLYRWVLEHVPPGSTIATETREVLLPADRYVLQYPRRLIDRSTDDYRDAGVDYLLASSQSFRVAFYVSPPEPAAVVGYTDLFKRNEHVITFMPSADHPGPELRLYRVLPRQ